MGLCVGHESCPSCSSKGGDTAGDNLARYDDGGAYCFACGHTEGPPNEGPTTTTTRGDAQPMTTKAAGIPLVTDLEFAPLTRRKIERATCEKFGYGLGSYFGKAAQVAQHRNSFGQVVAQHVRTEGKGFAWVGDRSQALPLWGQHLWKPGRRIAITEGEVDAMALAQVLGLKWPVVSLPSGCKDARNAIPAALDYLEQFDQVVLMFDADKDGQAAVAEVAPMFTPGKCSVASLPLKDAGAMLEAGDIAGLTRAFWEAPVHRPGGLVTVRDVMADALKPAEWGLPWPWESLTQHTYGRRRGEIITLGAGSGVGKTDMLTQVIAHILEVDQLPVAAFYLEGLPKDTVQRVAGKIARKPFHVPDGGWTVDELTQAVEDLAEGPTLTLLDHFGRKDWPEIHAAIRFLALADGVKDFFVDHLTALKDPKNERESLEIIMEEAASLAIELGVTIYIVSHLATPEGKTHEEGGQVRGSQFFGSRAIMQWSHFMLGLERNTQAEDPVQQQATLLRIIKDRYTGRGTGKIIPLGYNPDEGVLFETGDYVQPSAVERFAGSRSPGRPPLHPSDRLEVA